MGNENLILKVYENKVSGQKLVCIPKKEKIEAGELVKITKVKIKKESD